MTIPELQTAVGGVIQLPTTEALRRYVKWTLCRQEQLDPIQFTMMEVPLMRAGEACGLTFRLRGPRAVTLQAIWATSEQRLFCYDSAGNRFLKQQISIGE